ncbi:MAG TPA: LCP family protein [Solirubrobacteraceae bacterium]|jgi:LCP family protein required for cell wall assembly|nr:LCP family protein [Solirubrobacteraceae bacterium]
MPPPTDPEGPPEYRVYRSRKPLFGRAGGGDVDELAKLRAGARPTAPQPPRRGLSGGRVVRWILVAVAAWVALSIVAFLLSAQIQQGKVGDDANALLGGAGYPLWSPNNILVLGSDERTKDTREPGAQTGIGRSDSIMLLRVGAGANSRLSIARDTIVDVPGHGRSKINAAFAYGGAALAIRTVEAYTGVDVNHVVLVSFENFPALIDAMGGITYHGGCVVSRINGGFRNGGYTLRLRAGKTHIDGKQALALARTRHNDCNRREDDLTRARRQQKVISAMKRRLLSPFAFVRLPQVAWATPQSLRSDMSGPTLLGLFGALAIAGSPQTQVLGTQSGTVPASLRRARVRRFLAG